MSDPSPVPRGLTAAELATAVAELQALVGYEVLQAVPVTPADTQHEDLLLVLRSTTGDKAFVHIAPGGTRARVTRTALRFPQSAQRRGVAADRLEKDLHGARLTFVAATDGERRCQFGFATQHGDRRLVVELFGARGLWCLCDGEGRAVALSREVVTAVRTLRALDLYAPPPAHQGARQATAKEPPPRFAAPVLAAIDAHFAEQDQACQSRQSFDTLQRAAQRALGRANAKAAGIARQLSDTERSADLRTQADLMLAYAHLVARGAASMRVPDPLLEDRERVLPLDPSKPVRVQAQGLYEKARRLEQGRDIAVERLLQAQAEITSLTAVLARLSVPEDEHAALPFAELRAELQRLHALPPAPGAAATAARRSKPKAPPPGENFRRFVSIEGYPILVGRNNEQNDRLTMRVANGNDLWLHVAGGRPGSHVVIRLPKNKTASLETLLDAGTLAVHFSKARGESRIEVLYTQRKHVKKPKGLPAGAVVPSQTRTLTVQADAERLRRLLDSSGGDQD